MGIRLSAKDTKNISRTSILQQTAFWAKVKKKHGIESMAFDIKIKASDLYAGSDRQDYVCDDILVLFPRIGSGSRIGYVPYGPTIKPDPEKQGLFLEELSEVLRPQLPVDCLMLRYDLLWESPWAKDDSCYTENGDWTGPPSKAAREIRLNFATNRRNLRKPNSNVLPADTIFIDLNRDEDRILGDMKAKTRYNIRLSERKGITVRQTDIDDLSVWYELYRETCLRNSIYLESCEFFRAVLTTNTGDARSPARVELLVAECGDLPLASMFLVFTHKRATYLYGASSSLNRNFMATYALQWEAIRRAKKRGYSEYDLFGVSPFPDSTHPLYGLYRFKRGFGGRLLHRMGCWDYPFKRDDYQDYMAAELMQTGYHLH
ncbi:MAG: peptidoglycan bridge formation glycyltransferase FemA/FemB family protein [Spirochaetales bacterium]|nr:peptidoglycan bridge formation glycyltransferase FemA/FemB family protein [Spirochaetales bacterium]